MTKQILVAMSGGVDSSVAAALLKESDYDLVGVTMQIWPADQPHPEIEGSCCSLSAVDDARSVADKLGIPYYVMNFRDYFKEKVIDYFIEDYLSGRTPNPCIACNQHVKFEALLQKALAIGTDLIATGHYARIYFDDDRQRYVLAKAKDSNKDQTYVLYGFNQEQLSRTLMPLGEFTKPEIRQMAEEMGLVVAHKPESQEICFVPDNNYRNFLKDKVGQRIKPGPFLDTKGNKIGEHQGIAYYTIGQRHGLGLAMGKPIYVVDIDVRRNAVIVGSHEETFSPGLTANKNNFILFDHLESPVEVKVKIRYKAPPVPALVSPGEEGRVKVEFKQPQRAVTPGQAVVYYQDDLVMGGGTIEKPLR
ncbi:tRNA 2-thiouridine(34) synthase MnmA [Metallumcola ferriviriculae]|uniref:tRNA-specific 2-thiouridylase MnmA n=1 Tax=Metallumcola ferriviriculae TaxID=3039180 RepID=A0AAU0UQ11_9FIRM|nr:tRNA 2-thiouridine(34) synthase MnmA [Desulfitibacteraceae bacterium MK1]